MESLQDRSPQSDCAASRRHDALLAAGVLTVLAVLFYLPVLSTRWTFPDGDFTHHFLPFSQFMAESLRTFTPPLWLPFTYAGHPFWADVQAAVLYPVSNLFVLTTLAFTGDATRLYFLQVEALFHMLLAGYFTYLLVRDLTYSAWPAILSGIVFMLSGYLTGYPPLQLAVLRTAVWLPLVLWLLLRAWQEPHLWRYWIGAAFAFAVAFYAGHTQTWMFVAYASAGWVAALALGSMRNAGTGGDSDISARMLGVVGFAALAVGLMAAQLIPSMEFARRSVRAHVDYAYVSGGFPLRDTWQALLPGVLTHFSPLYIGIIALGLAAFAAVALAWGNKSQRTTDRVARIAAGYFLILSLLGLLASYGDNGFLYPILYRLAPGWDLFRGQERAAFLVAFGLSVLAGFGLAAVPASSTRLRRRFALIYGALVTGGVYTFGLAWQLPGNTVMGPWRFLLLAGTTLVLAMTLAVTLWLPGWNEHRVWLLCALAAANLMLVNYSTNLVYRTPAEAVALRPEVRELQLAVDAATDVTGLPGRAYNEFRVYEDYGVQAGVEDVWGSSPLRLSTYGALFDEFPLDRMFRLTGVSHVLTWRRELFMPSTVLAEYPQQEDTTYLHDLSADNPRMWVVGRSVDAADEQAIALLADHEFDLDGSVILPPGSASPDWGTDPSRALVQAERLEPYSLRVDVLAPAGGILVVSENWMPGWRVMDVRCAGATECELGAVHASGLPLLEPVRGNLSFLAIALPESDVQFRLVYAPNSVLAGVMISALTQLLLVMIVLYRLFAARRRTV